MYIVVGVAGTLAIVVGCLLLACKRRKGEEEPQQTSEDAPRIATNPLYDGSPNDGAPNPV